MTSSEARDKLRSQLIRHEGMRLRPYYDSAHHLTIGVGRNLESVGVSKDEALYLLSNDIDFAVKALVQYPCFHGLAEVRQAALVNLMFNVGPVTFGTFHRMLTALAELDYDAAADEMLISKWATEVGSRAEELSAQMRSGRWQA